MRRARAFAAIVVGVAFVACGGGGGGGGGGGPTSVTGTAARGAAIAGATLTLVDAAGITRTATTGADGTFTIDTTGLAPPFMIRLVNGETELFSVSAEARADTVINVTPLTDLILRSWYEVQGADVDAAFDAPDTNPAPSPAAVAVIASVVKRIVQLWLDQAGVAGEFDLISTPFTADGTGVDQVLDLTTIDPSLGEITVTDGDTTQTSQVEYSTDDGSISVDTTTEGTDGTSSSTATVVVPVAASQQTALEAITALADQFAATVNAEGSALTGSDLVPFMDPDMLQDGWTRAQYAAYLAGNLAGATVSFTPIAVKSLAEAGTTAEVSFQLAMTAGGDSGMELLNLFFRKVGDAWLMSGNDRIAEVELRSGMVVNQGAVENEGPILEVNVAAPEDALTGARIIGGPWGDNVLTQGAIKPTPAGNRDTFGIYDQVYIDAGFVFDITVTPAVGDPVMYPEVSNAVTSETVRFTGLSVTTVSGFGTDSPHTVSWTLPKTFAVAFVRLGRVAYDGDPNNPSTHACEAWQTLSASAATGAVTIPSTCNGDTVAAEIYVQAHGAAGEFTTAYYMLE